MMKNFVLIAVMICLLGCATGERLRPALTATNPDATHIWVLLTDRNGNDHVYYCDIEFLKTERPLCVASELFMGESETKVSHTGRPGTR